MDVNMHTGFAEGKHEMMQVKKEDRHVIRTYDLLLLGFILPPVESWEGDHEK